MAKTRPIGREPVEIGRRAQVIRHLADQAAPVRMHNHPIARELMKS